MALTLEMALVELAKFSGLKLSVILATHALNYCVQKCIEYQGSIISLD